jgi:hypothetical protein
VTRVPENPTTHFLACGDAVFHHPRKTPSSGVARIRSAIDLGWLARSLVCVASRGKASEKGGRAAGSGGCPRPLDLTDPSADRIPGQGGLTSGYAMSRSTPIASITAAVATWMP